MNLPNHIWSLANSIRLPSWFTERVCFLIASGQTLCSTTDKTTANSRVCVHNSSNPLVAAGPVSKDLMYQNLATPELHWSASLLSVNRPSCQRSPRPSQKSLRTPSPRSQPSLVCLSTEVLKSRFSICLVSLKVPQKAKAVVGKSFRLQRFALISPPIRLSQSC